MSKRLAPGSPVWALINDEERGTILAPGLVAHMWRHDRRSEMYLSVQRVDRDELPRRKFRRADGYVIERVEPTYTRDRGCIDCGSVADAPHEPACPFSE